MLHLWRRHVHALPREEGEQEGLFYGSADNPFPSNGRTRLPDYCSTKSSHGVLPHTSVPLVYGFSTIKI